jgi:hypothetical protein
MDGGMLGMITMMTSTSCWASNTPYLTGLAWCIHDKCAEYNVSNSNLELCWEHRATVQQTAGVKTVTPKWSYSETLANVSPAPPMNQLTLNNTWFKVEAYSWWSTCLFCGLAESDWKMNGVEGRLETGQHISNTGLYINVTFIKKLPSHHNKCFLDRKT